MSLFLEALLILYSVVGSRRSAVLGSCLAEVFVASSTSAASTEGYSDATTTEAVVEDRIGTGRSKPTDGSSLMLSLLLCVLGACNDILRASSS